MNNDEVRKLVRKIFILAEHYAEASRLLEEQSRGDQSKAEKLWGCSGPKLMVDSFAIELYLKCLYVMDMREKITGHDWKKLFNALHDNSKSSIRKEFARIVEDSPLPAIVRTVNPDAAKVLDFDRSFIAASETFDKRRYLYEDPKPPKAGEEQKEWYYAHLIKDAIRGFLIIDPRIKDLISGGNT
jgi:hypothetical protein